jgi:hypothetical protein
MITVICPVNRASIIPDQELAHDPGSPVGLNTPSNPP